MVQLRTLALSIIAASLFSGTLVSAQDLSVEEITEAFKKQKTRGLVIVPNASDPATGAASTETATIAAATEEYTPLDSSSQINVQVSFDFDSATLRDDQKPKLANMCASMQAMEGTVFQIIGHTDSSGSASYNERLSLLRAQEVRRHMIADCGVSADSLKAIGMGETAPVDAANPRADENRRVEFQALG